MSGMSRRRCILYGFVNKRPFKPPTEWDGDFAVHLGAPWGACLGVCSCNKFYNRDWIHTFIQKSLPSLYGASSCRLLTIKNGYNADIKLSNFRIIYTNHLSLGLLSLMEHCRWFMVWLMRNEEQTWLKTNRLMKIWYIKHFQSAMNNNS